ncbi:MAG: chorismate synthase [Eubacteriales bacterium]
MSRTGELFAVTVFGESHGSHIGCVIEGVPAGLALDMTKISAEMKRRMPIKSDWSTQRDETDTPEILSGVLDGVATGAPLTMVIKNKDQRSKDYGNLHLTPRPGHADYTAYIKYGGHNDIRGGGHFSGRLTAPLVFAGAVAKQVLAPMGIEVFAHIKQMMDVEDKPIEETHIDKKEIAKKAFPVIDDYMGMRMIDIIQDVRADKNSVGGVIECGIFGLEPGIGGPLFEGLDGTLARAIFGIPAVKGVAFGEGFDIIKHFGNLSNDAFTVEDGEVVSKTNHMGGVLGGISSGMPLIIKAAFKATPSISKPQETVNLETKEDEMLQIKGRHDPCILPRAVPVVEAVCAITILDEMMKNGKGQR